MMYRKYKTIQDEHELDLELRKRPDGLLSEERFRDEHESEDMPACTGGWVSIGSTHGCFGDDHTDQCAYGIWLKDQEEEEDGEQQGDAQDR